MIPVRVARKTFEAMDICSIELVAAEGGSLPPFSAGAHIDVHLPGGIIRQYSLCNNPAENHRYVLGVLKDINGRGGSRAVHEQLVEGDTLMVSQPRNHFPLVPSAQRSLLFAGGIGITPILSMAEHLVAACATFDLHYCGRSSERMAFLERIAASPFSAHAQIHMDDGPASQQLNLATELATPRPDSHLYVCGPKGFMDVVLSTARDAGWSEDCLHYEFFAADAAQSTAGSSFEIRLASSGRRVMVPEGKTAIAALSEAGIDVPVSCEQGVCGTCLTKVLEGQPDHRDAYLTPEEKEANDCFLPCCSRAKSAYLVLDL